MPRRSCQQLAQRYPCTFAQGPDEFAQLPRSNRISLPLFREFLCAWFRAKRYQRQRQPRRRRCVFVRKEEFQGAQTSLTIQDQAHRATLAFLEQTWVPSNRKCFDNQFCHKSRRPSVVPSSST